MPENEQNTFVAYIDISGFKSYLDQGLGRIVLDDFYNSGSKVVRENNIRASNSSLKNHIQGILISDCAILWITDPPNLENEWTKMLLNMLSVIRNYNIEMLRMNHLLTCSIAYGRCDYEPRIETDDIRKNSIFGQGYVRAFTDNEYVLPKIQPSQCRIVTEGLPNYPNLLAETLDPVDELDPETCFLNSFNNIEKSYDGKHLYYYWMLDSNSHLGEFKFEIKSESVKRYDGIKQIIKKYVHARINQPSA
jgi:hypothetical protein